MKSNFALAGCSITAFFLGCLITYLAMTKKQMDALLAQTKQPTAVNHTQSNEPKVNDESTNAPSILSNDILSNDTQSNGTQSTEVYQDADHISDIESNQDLTVNDYSQAQAKALIDDMPNYVLGQYVDKFMAKDASDVIADKRQFAERAIEELYKSNDNQPLSGDIRLAYDSSMPANSVDTSSIPKYAKLYAHFDTNGQVPASPYVFIKWVNNQTGQVLLFEQKSIIADSNQNWVSFKPDDGWQVGSYDIRFYQFTSELQPIAQLTYDIYEVVE